MILVGPVFAAPPIADKAAPTPVTTVSRDALDSLPQSRDLKALLDYHNQLRAGVGSAPLKWNPQLAARADAYARILAETGKPQHASRVGRATERENISLSPRGTNSARTLAGRWGDEGRFFRGGIFPNACTTDWSQCAHFTQMVWSGTTDVGCAFHQGRQFDALVCRYSPPGNQDGRPVIGMPPTRIAQAPPININNPGGGPILQNPPENQEGQADQDGGANDAGGTRERPRDVPSAPNPEEPFTHRVGECSVGIIAKIRLVEKGEDPDKQRKEPYNLKHGFSEIVVPHGWDAIPILKPDADATGEYTGRMRAIWGIADGENLKLYQISGSKEKLRAGIWDSKPGVAKIEPAHTPDLQTHRLWREWDPDPDTNPPKCEKEDRFSVTFAGRIDMPNPLNTSTFVNGERRDEFTGTRPRTPFTSGTRSFHETRPRPFSRNNNVVVPIGTYWDLPDSCCDIPDPERKVIQFARAAIEGPNGRQGKDWGLDINPKERERAQLNDAERARGESPTHDPTYTSEPRSNGDGKLNPGSGGGTRGNGSDVEQWDAPGMPKDLYDRLFAAQGPSVYRQQFLALLVCRPPGDEAQHHQTPFYLGSGRVCQVAVTTVRWDFPGQANARVIPPRQRGQQPRIVYNQTTIRVSFDVRDGHCLNLRAFLQANGLVDEFERPGGDARDLEIMEAAPFGELRNSVDTWETNPFNPTTGVQGI